MILIHADLSNLRAVKTQCAVQLWLTWAEEVTVAVVCNSETKSLKDDDEVGALLGPADETVTVVI